MSITRDHMTYLDLLEVNLQNRRQLLHVRVLVNADKNLVEQSFKVVSLDSVHYKPLEWADPETQGRPTQNKCQGSQEWTVDPRPSYVTHY